MAIVKPFCSIRPKVELANRVAALPYDVYNREEACQVVKEHPFSFLNIDRAETQFSSEIDMYDDRVYERARDLLEKWINDGIFIQEEQPCFYLYQLTMNQRSQIGLVACSSINDYEQGIIKKHENTREEKEIDRICHVDTTNAHTGPIFLAYRSADKINQIVAEIVQHQPLYDFISEDGVGHRIWKIAAPDQVEAIERNFQNIPYTYIADGHHRAASAVKVGQKRRSENADHTGNEEYNYFLSVLFPDDQLMIMPYNRVVRDLNGLTVEAFLQQLSEVFEVECKGAIPYEPVAKKTFGMFLEGLWYKLNYQTSNDESDPVKNLDVSILQENVLDAILNIKDPRTDQRIDFIGGIRGLDELERRVNSDMKVAFSMYPTSIEELLQVADADLLMPPKSTWFEPKLRSGLFIHMI